MAAEVTISCDVCRVVTSSSMSCVTIGPFDDTRHQARAEARRLGWRRRRWSKPFSGQPEQLVDVCPSCIRTHWGH